MDNCPSQLPKYRPTPVLTACKWWMDAASLALQCPFPKKVKDLDVRIPSAIRREQLVDATIEIMRENGVQSVTVRDVAARAKAPLAILHYCFKDKDDLINAAVDRWLKEMISDSMKFSTSGGVRNAVRSMLDSWWEGVERMPQNAQAQFELFLWALRNSEPVRLTMYPMYLQELTVVLNEALEISGCTCQWDTTVLARSLLVIVDGCSFQYFSDPENSGAKALSYEMAEALFDRAKILPLEQPT